MISCVYLGFVMLPSFLHSWPSCSIPWLSSSYHSKWLMMSFQLWSWGLHGTVFFVSRWQRRRCKTSAAVLQTLVTSTLQSQYKVKVHDMMMHTTWASLTAKERILQGEPVTEPIRLAHPSHSTNSGPSLIFWCWASFDNHDHPYILVPSSFIYPET